MFSDFVACIFDFVGSFSIVDILLILLFSISSAAGSWAGPAWFKMLLGLGGNQGGGVGGGGERGGILHQFSQKDT